MVSLEDECGVTCDDEPEAISFVRRLILSGSWSDVTSFLKPVLARATAAERMQIMASVQRQQLFEMQHTSQPAEKLVGMLAALREHCSKAEFEERRTCSSFFKVVIPCTYPSMYSTTIKVCNCTLRMSK